MSVPLVLPALPVRRVPLAQQVPPVTPGLQVLLALKGLPAPPVQLALPVQQVLLVPRAQPALPVIPDLQVLLALKGLLVPPGLPVPQWL